MTNLAAMRVLSGGFRPKYLRPGCAQAGHAPFAYFLMHNRRPAIVVALGETEPVISFACCQGIADAGASGHLHAIAVWEGAKTPAEPDHVTFDDVERFAKREFPGICSVMNATTCNGAGRFQDNSIDVLYLGASLSPTEASEILRVWLPKMTAGGYVLLANPEGNLRSAWESLNNLTNYAICFPHSHGLGVAQLPGGAQSMPWLKRNDKMQQLVRQIFLANGSRVEAEVSSVATFSRMSATLEELQKVQSVTQALQMRITNELSDSRSQLSAMQLLLDGIATRMPASEVKSDEVRSEERKDAFNALMRLGFRQPLSSEERAAYQGLFGKTTSGHEIDIICKDWAQARRCAMIAATGFFDRSWYMWRYPDVAGYGDGPILHFLRHGSADLRDPGPDFSIRKYLETHGNTIPEGENPLVHLFIQSRDDEEGEAESHRLRSPAWAISLPDFAEGSVKDGALAVVIHVFYLDVFKYILQRLKFISRPYTLVVTTPLGEQQDEILKTCERMGAPQPKILVCENRGRDILPKLIAAKAALSNVDVALFLHTKRSPHLAELNSWLDHTLECLCGSSQRIESVLKCFEEIPYLGMIGPATPVAIKPSVAWGRNFQNAHKVSIEIGAERLPDVVDFPAGSMFWARPVVLEPFINDVILASFEEEKGQTDDTIAHAIERLFFLACEWRGFEWFKVVGSEQKLAENVVIRVNSIAELMLVLEFGRKKLFGRTGATRGGVAAIGNDAPASIVATQ